MSSRTRKASRTGAAAARAAATIHRAVARAAARTAAAATAMAKPRVAITEGDPAGIGPEIARRAAADPRVLGVCEPVLYGAGSGVKFEPGVLSADAGKAAYDAIVRATADAQSGAVAAVAGLNPHAGEHGLFGREEETAIAPAIACCRAKGIDVSGPFPADTLFVRARKGEFDVVVACYHDQGLIPVKLAAFGRAVNVTLGLPIIRTSVDHGTAFDIAGKGIADPESMIAAVLLAARLAQSASASKS